MILVVDDDKVILSLIQSLLHQEGYETLTLEDGGPAYLFLEKHPECQGVILDVRMPRISGTELLMLMSASGMKTPVIIMTGYSDFDKDELGLFGNVKAVVKKPMYPNELLDLVQEHFNHGQPPVKKPIAPVVDNIGVSVVNNLAVQTIADTEKKAADKDAEPKITQESYLKACAERDKAVRRYEFIRRLNPRQFADLYADCLKNNKRFDDEVDRLAS
jgi:DNA-binding NtrC family response regulator